MAPTKRNEKGKEESSKSTPTEPTPSTQPFVKRIVDGGPYFYGSCMKYSMSSKDWNTAFKDLNQMMSADQD